MINVIHTKVNRPYYHNLFQVVIEGLQKINKQYQVITDVPKTAQKIVTADINISINGAFSKIGPYFEKAKVKKTKFIILDIAWADFNGPISLENREKYRLSKELIPTCPIFCNLFAEDYLRHKYIRNKQEKRTTLFDSIELKQWRHNGYILIPEQIRPEGFGFTKKIHNRGTWEKWLDRTKKFLTSLGRSDILLREHANRTAWPDIKKQSLEGKYNISRGKTLEQNLSGAQALITVSSKCLLTALLEGVPVYSLDKNSVAADLFTPTIKQLLTKPVLGNRQQWLKDISYSYWSMAELASGDYFDFMLKELI